MSPEDEQRLVAIARTAAELASRGSIDATLTSIAAGIHELDEVAAVQVVLAEPPEQALRLMGVAGFAPNAGLAEMLQECRRRGGALVTFDSDDAGVQRVRTGRRSEMLAGWEWEPLHDYIREVEWEDYVATPLPLREAKGGVINCYLVPGAVVTDALTEFLRIMADQAALAVDYHSLIERDRMRVRHDERMRMARDLHDSVIQQVVEIALASEGPVRSLARRVEAELREVVRALRPAGPRDAGLGALSTREREILTVLAHGLSNQEIATHIGISERTARTHVSNILMKLGLTSRTQAALLSRRIGLGEGADS